MRANARIIAVLATAFSLLITSFLLTGSGRFAMAQEDETEAPATVRFAHVYSGGGPIDIYVAGALTVENIDFGTATEYATFPAGEHQVQVVATGAAPSEALVDKELTFDSESTYNVLIGGQEEGLDARSYEVDRGELEPEQARIRFVQGEPGAGPVNIDLTAPTEDGGDADANLDDVDFPAFGDVGIDTGNDYQTVDAGAYGMVVTDADDDSMTVNLPDIDIDAGNVYDIVVLGQMETANLTFLPLITSVTPGCPDVLGVGETGDACVRMVHVSPDAGAVDIYLDGTVIAENLSYGTVTEFAGVPDGEHQIQVTATGEPVDSALLDETMEFDGGQAYQVAAIGIGEDDDDDGNDLRLESSEVDLSPIAPGQARIRAVHALPGSGAVTVSQADGVELFSGLEFGNASDYVVAEPGTFGLEVTDDEEDSSIVNAPDLMLEAGMTYDAFVIGQADQPDTLQILLLPTPTAILSGAQGTPIAVSDSEPVTEPVGEASPTTVTGEEEGGEMTPTTIGDAPVTPILTPEMTPTP